MAIRRFFRMKVRIWTRYPWSILSGGAEVQAGKYVEYGLRKGVDMALLDPYTPRVDYDILHLVGLDYNSLDIVRTAKSKGVKVAISPVYYTTPLKAQMISLGLRLIRTRHLAALNRLKYALELADVILPNSQAEKRQIIRVFGLGSGSGRIHVIYNGTDIEEGAAVDRGLFSSRFGIKGDYILSVSMIDWRKNNLRLVDGFLRSGSQKQLVIIGDARDGDQDYIARFQELVRRCPDRIRHIPCVTERDLLRSAYAGASAHVLPSFVETPGLSNLEAARFGCTLVVGDCEPVREYFGDCPFYVNPRNADSIASGIVRAERQDRSQDSKRVSERYSWNKIVDDLVQVYSHCLRMDGAGRC